LADRFSKPLIIGYVKLAEIGIMLFAALASGRGLGLAGARGDLPDGVP
jgi:hypothetical protein